MFMFSTVNKQTLLFEKTFSLCYYFFGNFFDSISSQYL